MSKLHFRRPFQFSQGLQNWRLYLDDQVVASIGNGASVDVPVSPGTHAVSARTASMYSSRVLSVTVEPGETLDIEVGSNVAGWRVIFGAVYLFTPSDYLYLRLKSRHGRTPAFAGRGADTH